MLHHVLSPLPGAFALFAAALCYLAAPAAAQLPLVPVSIEVNRYDEILEAGSANRATCCAPQIYASGPDADFIHVRVVFDVAFTDAIERVSVNSSDIVLITPDAPEGLASFGYYRLRGVFEDGVITLTARRPRDWPASTVQAVLDSVWLVPDGTAAATLRLGADAEMLEIPVNLGIPPGSPIAPGSLAQVVVTGFEAMSTLEMTRRRNRVDMATSWTAGAGQIVRIDVAVTPLVSNDTPLSVGRDRYVLPARHLMLVGPDGMPMLPLGQDVLGGLQPEWSNSVDWDSGQPAPPEVFSLHYLGAPTAGTYTLYLLQDPVAQFTLQ